MPNPKGNKTKVDPIRNLSDIKRIKNNLKNDPRSLCLFTLGINCGLRASDLLQIKVGMVRNLQPGEDFEIKERKTGKPRRITLNKSVYDVVQNLIRNKNLKDSDPLFLGERGCLTVPSVLRMVKKWCKGLDGNYASHTLRKTFGYQMRVQHDVGIPVLMDIFNHSNQRQTLNYLCIQDDEIKKVYLKEI